MSSAGLMGDDFSLFLFSSARKSVIAVEITSMHVNRADDQTGTATSDYEIGRNKLERLVDMGLPGSEGS